MKIGQIVRVQHRYHAHFGQVMSHRVTLPGVPDTFMVRMVPGYPGTLQEIPAGALTEIDSGPQIHFVHYARVMGMGLPFPVDMLRYDFASPINFKLVEKEDELPVPLWEESFGLEGLWIAKATPNKNPMWSRDRWRSFSWIIEPQKSERIADWVRS